MQWTHIIFVSLTDFPIFFFFAKFAFSAHLFLILFLEQMKSLRCPQRIRSEWHLIMTESHSIQYRNPSSRTVIFFVHLFVLYILSAPSRFFPLKILPCTRCLRSRRSRCRHRSICSYRHVVWSPQVGHKTELSSR